MCPPPFAVLKYMYRLNRLGNTSQVVGYLSWGVMCYAVMGVTKWATSHERTRLGCPAYTCRSTLVHTATPAPVYQSQRAEYRALNKKKEKPGSVSCRTVMQGAVRPLHTEQHSEGRTYLRIFFLSDA